MTQFKDNSAGFLRNAENAVERAIARGAISIQAEAKRLVSQHESPPPSIPFEPPHKDTGTLGRSIEQETFERDGDFIGRIGTNLKYGLFLELGTRTMGPRPHLRPALDKMRNRIVAEIKRAGGKIGRGR